MSASSSASPSQFKPLSYLPEPVRCKASSRLPYIYSASQVSILLAKASGLPPGSSLLPHTYTTLFGLLYTTGIRIGEALAMNLADVYLNRQRLHIRNGKFHKARWIPLSPSTCDMLRSYIDKRVDLLPLASDDPLFVSLRKKRLARSTVYSTLRRLLKECDIHTGNGMGPRIHDFRHTFAVHRLLSWYREGLDVNAMQPTASKRQSISSTLKTWMTGSSLPSWSIWKPNENARQKPETPDWQPSAPSLTS